jgi:hypothetical protein
MEELFRQLAESVEKLTGRPNFYILIDHEPVPISDPLQWGRFFNEHDLRTVGRDEVGDVLVSTVFLGLDYRFFGDGPPLLFETMMFGGEFDQQPWRFATWDQAEAFHKACVRMLKDGRNDIPFDR